ncbi:MAG: type V CRISPR-associated protein Cas4 [Lentisphaeria bacterium]|nr:type V CRISPR-associated protein Cas4 [Lentisphaeria bacterium]
METYLTFTQINDFIFCPRSIFFHDFLRENFAPSTFRETPQVLGLAAHAAIDEGRYSSRKDILQGTMVFSARYNLLGKIDLFFMSEGRLVERKRSITAVYDGFRYQLYAQKFALEEQGFEVKKLELYSSKDNKKYDIPQPSAEDILHFEGVLEAIRSYRMETDNSRPDLNKCRSCNYREICTCFPEEERL